MFFTFIQPQGIKGPLARLRLRIGLDCDLPILYGGQFLCVHVGIGPPSGAGSIGAAAAKYVPNKPTIRINILIARCMDCSPCVRASWERKPSRAGIIPPLASFSALVTYSIRLPVRLGWKSSLD